MKAFKLVQLGKPGKYVDVPVPTPGPGEVLVRMKAVGLCRSDLDMVDGQPGSAPYANSIPEGYALGHENAGVVEELGVGVRDLKKGEVVATASTVLTARNGTARPSSAMRSDNPRMRSRRGTGRVSGRSSSRTHLHRWPGSGLLRAPDGRGCHGLPRHPDRRPPAATRHERGRHRGWGLGAFGLQFIKLLSQARIFALDISPERLKLARELGAHEVVPSDEKAADTILELTGGRGVDGIIDFVGSDQSLALAAKIPRPRGRIVLVGMQGGKLTAGWNLIAPGCEFAISLGSTRQDSEGMLPVGLTGASAHRCAEVPVLRDSGSVRSPSSGKAAGEGGYCDGPMNCERRGLTIMMVEMDC